MLSKIIKRDGSLVDFDIEKLAASIARAASNIIEPTQLHINELSEAISLSLSHKLNNQLQEVTTEDIAYAVEKVLKATQHNEIADAYINYRNSQTKLINSCRVFKPKNDFISDADIAITVNVNNELRVRSWNRTEIINSLEKEAHISGKAAQEIARTVEQKIIDSGLKNITTALIRAITDNELLTRGYSSVLKQRSVITVPCTKIKQLIADNCTNINEKLLLDAMPAYCLTHIYSNEIAMAQRRGVIALGGLNNPAHTYGKVFPAFNSFKSKQDFKKNLIEVFFELYNNSLSQLIFTFDVDEPLQHVNHISEIIDFSEKIKESGRVVLQFRVQDSDLIQEVFAVTKPLNSIQINFYGEDHSVNSARAIFNLLQYGWSVAYRKQKISTEIHQVFAINMPQTIHRSNKTNIDSVIDELENSIAAIFEAAAQYTAYFQKQHQKRENFAVCVYGLNESVKILTANKLFEQSNNFSCEKILINFIKYKLEDSKQKFWFCANLNLPQAQKFSAIDQSIFPELFGYLPLDPENLETVIPPYKMPFCSFKNCNDIATYCNSYLELSDCFDCGAFSLTNMHDELAVISTMLLLGASFSISAATELTRNRDTYSPYIPGIF